MRPIEYALKTYSGYTIDGMPYLAHLQEAATVLLEYGYASPLALELIFYHKEPPQDFDPSLTDALDFLNPHLEKSEPYLQARWITKWKQLNAPDWLPTALRVLLAIRIAIIRNALRGGNSTIKGYSEYREQRDSFQEAYYVPGVCDEVWEGYRRLLRSTTTNQTSNSSPKTLDPNPRRTIAGNLETLAQQTDNPETSRILVCISRNIVEGKV